MMGGEFNVSGMEIDIPFTIYGHGLPEYIDIRFIDKNSGLNITISEKQAYALVEKLTDYLGKLTAERFKRKINGERGFEFK
jgi:serine kinase of HPr protein (carbohydrate metabolism regulator)